MNIKEQNKEAAKTKDVQIEEEIEKIRFSDIEYTNEEISYRDMLIRRIESARIQREQKHNEFDGMTYTTYYETNAKTGNSYNPPKTKKDETRIVTGVTLEKENILLNAILNLNLEPDVEALGKDDIPVIIVGEAMETVIRKTRIIEEYDAKRRLIYKEGLDQGTFYVQELNVQKEIVEKVLKTKNYAGIKVEDMEWTTKIKKLVNTAECELIEGLKVYLGNFKQFFMAKQPYISYVAYVPYDVAKSVFGKFDRWEHVPRKGVKDSIMKDKDGGETYHSWRLHEAQPDLVEIVFYEDKWANEYQIILNGVMMLKIGFPLSAITGDGEYSLIKGDLEPISWFFAISKSVPAKTKVPQVVLDEFIRLIVLKTQKSYAPPYTYRGSRVLSKRIFRANNIANGINPDDLKELGKNDGVTTGEVGAFKMVKEIIDGMSVSPGFEGVDEGGKTATQVIEDRRQNLLKIGMAITGIILFEKALCYRRLQNVLHNQMNPTDKALNNLKNKLVNVYNSFTGEATFNGRKGMRQVILSDEEPDLNTLKIQEQADGERLGMPVKKVIVNPSILRSIKYKWYIEIVPTEKNTSELKMALFKDKIMDAGTLFGVQSLNLEALKGRYAQLAQEDEDVLFIKGQPSVPAVGETGGFDQAGGGKSVTGDMAGSVKQLARES